MKAVLIIVGVAVLALILALLLGLVSFDQTQTARLPEVEVKEGQMPAFDADVADVDVTTENRTVEVPVLDVERADQ